MSWYVSNQWTFAASRTDLALVQDDSIIRRIFTTGVQNGNTTGATYHPFTKGKPIEECTKEAYDFVENFCEDCVAHRHHTRDAGCGLRIEIEELELAQVFDLMVTAKRKEVAYGILDAIRQYYS